MTRAATRLADLGSRLCIMGPSNSGKSTLATAIAQARGMEAIHLDQLHHQPHTDWQPRPAEEFAALHDQAILGRSWVMDGNYSRLLPQRLRQASGLILLDVVTSVSLARYLRRCWFPRHRHGGLDGASDRVRWRMIRHILGTTRANRRRYRSLVADTALPSLVLASPRALAAFYRTEGLRR